MVLYDNDIMELTAQENVLIEIEDWQQGIDWVSSFSQGRKYCNLFIAAENIDIDAKVRELLASKSENKYTIADAFVISGWVQRLLFSFYLRFNKPVKPTKIFQSRKVAVDWLLSQQLKFNNESVNYSDKL